MAQAGGHTYVCVNMQLKACECFIWRLSKTWVEFLCSDGKVCFLLLVVHLIGDKVIRWLNLSFELAN